MRLSRTPIGVSLLLGACLIGVGMFLPWQRTVERGGQTFTQPGIHLAGPSLLIIAVVVAVCAAIFLAGGGRIALRVTMFFLALASIVSLFLAVNGIGFPETTELVSFSFDIGLYMIALGTVVLVVGTALALKGGDQRNPDGDAIS